MTDQTWLQSLKVGDEVAVRRDHDDKVFVGTVRRLTKLQIVVVSKTSELYWFWKSNGRGVERAPYQWLVEPTSEIKTKAEQQAEWRILSERMEWCDFDALSLDQLRRIVAILDEPRKGLALRG